MVLGIRGYRPLPLLFVHSVIMSTQVLVEYFVPRIEPGTLKIQEWKR